MLSGLFIPRIELKFQPTFRRSGSILTQRMNFQQPSFCFSGNWSRLHSSFGFSRRAGYFLIHIYAPCALIVILSWISFCIPPDSTAARIALGITSVLTITTILNMLNTTMPKVMNLVGWIIAAGVFHCTQIQKKTDFIKE